MALPTLRCRGVGRAVNAVGTVVPELGAEQRDGTWWADVDMALWTPIPDQWGGGWAVITRVPFGTTQQRIEAGTRAYGPYVAVMAVPTEEGHDGGGLRGD